MTFVCPGLLAQTWCPFAGDRVLAKDEWRR